MKKPQLCEMTVKEKIGQMLMIHGTWWVGHKEISNDKGAFLKIIEEYQPGFVWLVGLPRENPYSFSMAEDKEYTKILDKCTKYPLLYAEDSESGLAYRYYDATSAVGALTVGAADNEELTYKLYKGIAAENRAAGLRWRWAPVVDIPNRLAAANVGRSVSDDPDKIIKHAIATMRAQESEGVVTCVKHFPGCDPYEFRDGHFSSPAITITLDEWEKTQGRTFKGAIDAGVMSIMTTHTSFPDVDDEMLNGKHLAGTLSEKIINGLLRKRLGFNGVIITDDISMGGFQSLGEYGDLLIRTVNAGHDVLLGIMPNDIHYIYEAVEDGRIPMSRIDESCQRILDMKEKIGLFDDVETPYTSPKEAKKMILEANQEIAEGALTLLYDRNNLIPVSRDAVKRVAVVYLSHDEKSIERMDILKREFAARGAGTDIYDHMDFKNCDEVYDHDLIIYAGRISPHNPYGMPSFHGDKMKTFFNAFAKNNERSIGLSLGYPYIHIDCMTGANTFVNAYALNENTLTAFVKAIYGEIPFVGKSPVDIEPKRRVVYC